MKRYLLACFALMLLHGSPLTAQTTVRDTCLAVDSVIGESMKYLDTPYRWAGKTPKGFDCAGFTRYVFSKFGVSLAPSAGGQYRECRHIADSTLQVGDLVFYGGRKSTKAVGHVGLVTEVNDDGSFRFIHSSTQSGIVITYSKEPYYRKRYIGACRIIVCNSPEAGKNTGETP